MTGAQIVVLDRGRIVWSKASGVREPKLAMDRDTTNWAASITKSVFATYVMQLGKRGEFELDSHEAKLAMTHSGLIYRKEFAANVAK